MLAKVVAWGADRSEALAPAAPAPWPRPRCSGVTTNVGFLRRLIDHPDVVAGRLDTGLVERIAADLLPATRPRPTVVAAAALLDGPARRARRAGRSTRGTWRDGWRLGRPGAAIASRWQVDGEDSRRRPRGTGTVRVGDGRSGGRPGPGSAGPRPRRRGRRPRRRRYAWAADGDAVWLGRDGDAWALTRQRETIDRTGPAAPRRRPAHQPHARYRARGARQTRATSVTPARPCCQSRP